MLLIFSLTLLFSKIVFKTYWWNHFKWFFPPANRSSKCTYYWKSAVQCINSTDNQVAWKCFSARWTVCLRQDPDDSDFSRGSGRGKLSFFLAISSHDQIPRQNSLAFSSQTAFSEVTAPLHTEKPSHSAKRWNVMTVTEAAAVRSPCWAWAMCCPLRRPSSKHRTSGHSTIRERWSLCDIVTHYTQGWAHDVLSLMCWTQWDHS